jgi:hypothetical protein
MNSSDYCWLFLRCNVPDTTIDWYLCMQIKRFVFIYSVAF